jgi:hypothetical protein
MPQATPPPLNLAVRLNRIERQSFSESSPENAPFKPEQVNLQFQTSIVVAAAEKSVKIVFRALATLQPEARELFQITTVHDYVIDNISQLPTRGSGNDVQIDFPQDLILNFIANAYAGTRGILYQSLRNEAFRNLPLPMVDPTMLLPPRNPGGKLGN